MRYVLFLISLLITENVFGELRVACNLPMTRDLAIYGASVREGVDFFREELSPEKNALVHWDWQDNEGSGRNTLTILRMQLQKKPISMSVE